MVPPARFSVRAAAANPSREVTIDWANSPIAA
jgi:hypothetical protein